MRLKGLTITSLPGIQGDFHLKDIAPGVNLVTGPNAIGKSSLIRALRYLVAEPAASDPKALVLSAEFENGERRRVSRTGSQQQWEVDGRPVEAPPLPEADALSCYWLKMEDLLEKTASDERLVVQLKRDLAQGFDLPALRGGPFEIGPRAGQSENRDLRDSEKKLRDVEAEYQSYRDAERRLPALEEEIASAKEAGRRADRLNKALALLEIRKERAGIEAGLETDFPAGMDRLRGDEIKRLEQCLDRRVEAERQLAIAHRERDDARQGLQATGLAERRPQVAELRAQRDRLGEAQRLDQQLADKRAAVAKAKAAEAEALERLGGQSEAPTLTTEAVSEAEEFAHRLDKERRRQTELKARLDAVPREEPSNAGRLPLLLAALGGLLAAGAALVAEAWVALVGGLLALAGAAWSALTRQRGGTTSAREQVAKEDLRELEQTLRQLESERAALAKRLGFDPALTAQGIDHFVRFVSAYHQAVVARRELEGEVGKLEQARDSAAGAVVAFLRVWGIESDTVLADLKARLDELEQRQSEAEKAEQLVAQLDKDIERLEQDIDERRSQEAELYREAGLEPGDRRGLEARIERWDAWKAQRERLLDARGRENERRSALGGEEELLAQVEADEHEWLEDKRAEAEEEAADLAALQDERTTIRRDLERAGTDHKLASALADVDAARSALEDRLDEVLFAEAGQFLLDEVEAEHRKESEPETLADARERFRRFTHQDWDIELDDEAGLVALDCRQQARRGLDALSTGTRMQLLLAMRLAWLRQQEQGRASLPLFLDEALTTSDEARFAVVAKSLEQLAAEEGRQVFYLSARRHELALWERATGQRPHHIDLARVRAWRTDAEAADFELPEAESLPEPGQDRPEDYAARLGVPAADPRQPTGSLPLFYLLRDDLVLLHRLMDTWRVTSLGQLEGLLAIDAANSAIPEAAMRERLAGRCAAARAWIAAWQRGRGRPVDRPALEESGAVSDAFIDRVSELAESLQGDGEALVAALRDGEVPRFRRNSAQDLEEWLSEHGYIDPEEPLDRDARQRETLARVAKQAQPEDIEQLLQWLEAAPTVRQADQTPARQAAS
ncbi:hypothetical protein [Natronospira sp.]|uniref:hypothetical protein n=1 Tax=Natronospira sp. TaxID=2024970 RepID=UPI003872C3C0